MFPSWNPAQPEITDLIVQHDPETLQRLPVRKQEVLEVFARFGNRKAVRTIQALPESGGILDDRHIDREIVQTHWEMQRLAEEFYQGQRAWELLRPVLASIRAAGVQETLRIADVGCGIGFTVRWLAANVPLQKYNIELLGVDLNSTLIKEANRLAALESLPCRFLHCDAFSPDVSAHIFMSIGVVHHFRDDSLLGFLRRHEQPGAQAFLHFDFQPWFLAPWGSLFFHYLRMRTAIALHDGVLSAARAHDAETLTAAARTALPGFASGIYGARIWNTPAPRVFHTLLGLRRELVVELRHQLGRRIGRLGELQ